MRTTGMPATIRLSNSEQELIRQKAIEVNKSLIKHGKQPLKDSEIVHKILEKTVPYIQVNASGEIVIGSE